MIDAALFDFSGTLFRLDYTEQSLTSMLGEHAATVDADSKAELLRKLTSPAGMSTGLTDDEQRDWLARDLDPAAHRRANLAVLRVGGLTDPVAAAFYEGMLDPANWDPYPDTAQTLKLLRDNGIPIAVISNIAWDVRPCFARAGIENLVNEYVFSFEVGAMKPDPEIFRLTCKRLDVEPSGALMVGDSVEADGGATAIGCRFAAVTALPTTQRPTALIDIVRAALRGDH